MFGGGLVFAHSRISKDLGNMVVLVLTMVKNGWAYSWWVLAWIESKYACGCPTPSWTSHQWPGLVPIQELMLVDPSRRQCSWVTTAHLTMAWGMRRNGANRNWLADWRQSTSLLWSLGHARPSGGGFWEFWMRRGFFLLTKPGAKRGNEKGD